MLDEDDFFGTSKAADIRPHVHSNLPESQQW